MESKPTSSAVLTIRSSVRAISGVPPGYENEGTWRPNFSAGMIFCPSVASCSFMPSMIGTFGP